MAKTSLKTSSRPRVSPSSACVATRCNCCGRPRSVYRKFGLCRGFAQLALRGDLPGVTKSSW